MSRSSSGGRGGLRTLALVAAVAIALASTAVVVLSDDKQMLRLAVVGALWAFLLAAFAAPRRREPQAPAGDSGGAQELRRTYEAELEKEVDARREYELQLEVYLRRELESGLAEDVAALREEVARLRSDMIDRLDGELQMERIQSTRLIGGSLRALRDEARRFGMGLPVPPELAGDRPSAPVGQASGNRNGSGEYSRPGGPLQPAASQSGPQPGPAAQSGSAPRSGPVSQPGPGQQTGLAAQSGPAPRPASGVASQPGAPPPGPSQQPGSAPLPGLAAQDGPGPQPGSAPQAGSAPPAGPPPQTGPPSQTGPLPGRTEPRPPSGGEPLPRRRRRSRDDGEDNEVMSRLLGR